MRRSFMVLLIAVAACAPSAEQIETTDSSPSQSTLPTTTMPSSTTAERPTTTASLPTTTLPEMKGLEYVKVADLRFPVQVTANPGQAPAYVATKDGRVWVLDDQIGETPVLDISDRVRDSGEQGLLSIAISDDFAFLYVHYSLAGSGDTVVAEYRMESRVAADPSSERILLHVAQPASNHNGGMIQIVDDVLYVGLGDGGGGGDQFGNGQNTSTFLGGIVTLQLEGDPSPTLFSYGLRNPWRFWVDDGLMYIADVGQGAYEEVSVVQLQPGLNFGWPIAEGLHCFRPSSGCDPSGTVLPVVEIAHGDAGTCSITGGVVYRGSEIPELDGWFLYSDYCGGYLRGLHYADGVVVAEEDFTDRVGVPGGVVGFGVDWSGEVYVGTTDALYRLTAVR